MQDRGYGLPRIRLLETVWKIAEGFLTVRFWRQEASDRLLSAAFGGLRSFDSGLIPIFQTVSLGTWVNRPWALLGACPLYALHHLLPLGGLLHQPCRTQNGWRGRSDEAGAPRRIRLTGNSGLIPKVPRYCLLIRGPPIPDVAKMVHATTFLAPSLRSPRSPRSACTQSNKNMRTGASPK